MAEPPTPPDAGLSTVRVGQQASMTRRGNVRLAWRQLVFEGRRLVAATAGVAFAVMLMLIQTGFYYAMIDSATNTQRNLASEVVIVPADFEYFGSDHTFSRARLLQALGVPGVDKVTPLYLSIGSFRNVETGYVRSILCIAVDPAREPLRLPSLTAQWDKLKIAGHVLFDRKGLQAYFGDVPARFARHGPFVSELFSERVTVDGLFDLGTSFIAFGNVLMSTHTYFALNRNASPDRVNVGLVRIRAGADAGLVQDRIAARLAGGDVQVLTRQAFIDREIDYWNSTAAVGLLFVVGAFMGFVVGSVIVYQILYTSVSDHISEYATLKAMGFRDLYFVGLVLKQAVYLSVLGFVPGALMSAALYAWVANVTGYTMAMTWPKATGVLLATILMCLLAGLLAVRRLKKADPAELFQ